jgi:hypothetical protein
MTKSTDFVVMGRNEDRPMSLDEYVRRGNLVQLPNQRNVTLNTFPAREQASSSLFLV